MTFDPHQTRRNRMACLPGIVLAAILFLPGFAAAQDLAANSTGIWSIAAAHGMDRWIVIHDPGMSKANGVFHIEVIGRRTGDPSWQIVHLAPHMAITESALLASIIEPLPGGAVYPESFDDAYAAWQAQNDGAGGSVCTSAVIECMPDGGSDEK